MYTEVIGVEKIGKYDCWKIKITTSAFSPNAPQITTTMWVDQDTGVAVKIDDTLVSEGGNLEKRTIILVDLDKDWADREEFITTTDGNTRELSSSNPASYYIFLITRDLQVGDWYPWKTDRGPWQVIGEENVSAPAGDFSCWVIKQGDEGYYYLRYFDKEMGFLVKEEFWNKGSGTWKKISEILLDSFRNGETER
jgi:hypothetical protein